MICLPSIKSSNNVFVPGRPVIPKAVDEAKGLFSNGLAEEDWNRFDAEAKLAEDVVTFAALAAAAATAAAAA